MTVFMFGKCMFINCVFLTDSFSCLMMSCLKYCLKQKIPFEYNDI